MDIEYILWSQVRRRGVDQHCVEVSWGRGRGRIGIRVRLRLRVMAGLGLDRCTLLGLGRKFVFGSR